MYTRIIATLAKLENLCQDSGTILLTLGDIENIANDVDYERRYDSKYSAEYMPYIDKAREQVDDEMGYDSPTTCNYIISLLDELADMFTYWIG